MDLKGTLWTKTKADGAMAFLTNRSKKRDPRAGFANKLGMRNVRLERLGRIHKAKSLSDFDDLVNDLGNGIVGHGIGKFQRPRGEIREMFRYLSKDLGNFENVVECWFILNETRTRVKEVMIVDAGMMEASLIHHWKQDHHGADYKWIE